MKTVSILLTLVLMVVTGIASYMFFEKSAFILSAVLTVASYLSVVTWVYLLGNRKVALS